MRARRFILTLLSAFLCVLLYTSIKNRHKTSTVKDAFSPEKIVTFDSKHPELRLAHIDQVHHLLTQCLKESCPELAVLTHRTAQYLQNLLTTDPAPRSDLQSMARQVRTYGILSKMSQNPKYDGLFHRLNLPFVKTDLKQLEKQVFPWVDLEKLKFSGRGIIIPTGSHHFLFAVHAILTFRYILNSKLPIEVFYMGDGDLDEAHRKLLKLIPNVELVDLYSKLDKEKLNVGGWANKPFSVLASNFEEVILVDADVLFLQDPAVLFEKKEYKETGTLFFHDRSINWNHQKTHDFIKTLVKFPSEMTKSTRFWNEKTVHEMESGVVVIDKKRALQGLLTVCKMNDDEERKIIYEWVHGDKETYWTGFDVAMVPYAFLPTYAGTIGYVNPKSDESICGGLHHVDDNKDPLWWNGGVLVNKHFNRDLYLNFTHYAFDGYGEKYEWQWETKDSPFCLKPTRFTEEVQRLTNQQIEKLELMVAWAKKLRQEGDLDGKWEKAIKDILQ
jgi:hypothetical protein